MIKVDNKRTVASLSRNDFKANKKRNLVMILAIALTTFMLTTVFSIGVSYITSYNERNIQMNGMDYDAMVARAGEETLGLAKNADNVKAAGQSVGIGMITKYKGVPTEIGLLWGDEECWAKMITPATEYIKGEYPQKRDEIMLSKKALNDLEIKNPKIGMKIKTDYFTQMTEEEMTWTLTGYYNDYTNQARAYVSDELHDEAQTGSNIYLQFENPLIDEEYIDQLSKDLNLEDSNPVLADTEIIKILVSVIIGISGLALLIIISGFLLIYNIMYISISKDVRYYGLLKTVGITSKQISIILRKQIGKLAIIGIPFGLVLGALVSLLVVPSIVNAVSILGGDVSFNPIIYVGAAVFALITIILSTRKPVKIAKNISPVEATRFTPIKSNKTTKKSTKGASVSRMAWSNVFRDKKRMTIVFLSLIIGLSTFMASSAIVKSNGADNYLNTYSDCDITINNKSMAFTYDGKDPKQLITQDLIKQIDALHGVESTHIFTGTVINIPYQDSLSEFFKMTYDLLVVGETYEEGLKSIEERPDEFFSYLVGIDENVFDDYNQTLAKPIDKEKFLKGEIGLIRTIPQYEDRVKNTIGKEIKFDLPDDEKQSFDTIEIADIAEDARLNVQYAGFWDNIIVSENYINKLVDEPIIDHLEVVYKEPYDEKTEAEIKSLISGDKLLKYESKIDQHKNMKATENQLTIFGGGIALVLAILGLMNYINMITADIQNRKNELAILQGIGMTSKQQRNMLTMEGFFYSVISIIIACIVGTTAGYFLFQSLNMYDVGYVVPIVSNLIFFAIIMIICVATPPIVYKLMTKSSIVDQLRDIE